MRKVFIFLSALSFFTTLLADDLSDIHSLEPLFPNYKKALEHCLEKSFEDFSVKSFSAGYSTAKNFYLKIDNQEYVLKIYDERESFSKIQGEFYAMKEGARMGISPPIYCTFLEQKAILMDYIPFNSLSIEQGKDPINCIKIAKTIRKAHAMERNPYIVKNFRDKTENLYAELTTFTKENNLIKDAIDLIRKNDSKLARFCAQKVNIHGDLNSHNIFVTDQGAMFIDWLENQWEDPFYDLTFFALLQAYDLEHELLLLSTYLERDPTDDEWDRFLIIKKNNLAGLCLTCHYVMYSLLSQFPNESIDCSSSIQDWSYYVDLFAESESLLSAQFFFEAAQCVLKYAQSF